MFLDGVIGEMLVCVRQFVKTEHISARANVAFFIPVAFQYAVVAGKHHVGSDIELSPMIEKRLGDIALHNKGAALCVGSWPNFLVDNSGNI